ncbi:MAG: fasciclin domain-containing protein, partial [Chloroflexota bacterium]
MNKRNRTGAFAGLIIAATFVGACSSAATGGTSAPTTAVAPTASAAPVMSTGPTASTAAMSQPFGPACASVPATGSGSFSGMATDPVATAASNNPALKTLVSAVTAAGLGDTLNTAKDITVFAPADSAFAAMDKATLDAALKDPKGLLTKVLTYHVVPGRLTPEMLVGTHTTLNGAALTVAGSGEDFTVNGKAKVVCGNVQTANATVYII